MASIVSTTHKEPKRIINQMKPHLGTLTLVLVFRALVELKVLLHEIGSRFVNIIAD